MERIYTSEDVARGVVRVDGVDIVTEDTAIRFTVAAAEDIATTMLRRTEQRREGMRPGKAPYGQRHNER